MANTIRLIAAHGAATKLAAKKWLAKDPGLEETTQDGQK